MSPSSFLVLWHIMHDSSMHVRNWRKREAFLRIDSSSSVTMFLCNWLVSTKMQCDILSTSKCRKPSKMIISASLDRVEHLRLNTFSLGRYNLSVEAQWMSQGPMILSSEKFLQFLAIVSMRYGGFFMLGIVMDSRFFHVQIAFRIPVFFIRFQAGKTSLLSCGLLFEIKMATLH